MKKSISVSIKLILSNLSYAIPVVILVYLLSAVHQENINFASQELKGNFLQNPLEELYQQIGTHSIVAQRALHGDKKSVEILTELDSKIEKSLTLLDQRFSDVGIDLQFTDAGLAQRQREHLKFDTFKKEWMDLKTNLSKLKPEESVEKHAHLITDIHGMITHLGDTSNLILDPDLDSYYLMDSTLVTLPQMQERLVDIITQGELLARRKNLTIDNKKWLVVSAALLKQSDLDRFTGDVQTSINEDKNFYGTSASLQKNLPPATEELKKEVEQLIKNLDEISNGENSKISVNQFLESAEGVYNKSFDYWKLSTNELDRLLQFRIDAQVNKKNQNLLYSLIALVVAALFSTLLGLSIKNSIVASIVEVLAKLKNISSTVEKSNKHLVHTSESLASDTNQQASAIQETVSTLDEISSMTEKSSDGALSSANEAKDSQLAAAESKKSMNEMVSALTDINQTNNVIIDQVNDSNKKIIEIVEMIQEIGNKTKIINEIVFQTKLLSFNASVEAARAGEHGKGFSVVAEEIGNLAQMSGNAAKEISTLLEQSTQKVNTIVSETKRNIEGVIDEGRHKMEIGMQIASTCETSLSLAVEKVETVTKLMDDIASATKEQSIGVSEITKAMSLLETSTHKNTMAAEEASNLAKELEEQAIVLRETITDLEGRIGLKTQLAS